MTIITGVFALFLMLAVVVGVFALYMLPAIFAIHFNHPQKTTIALINVVFGWTFIGWGVALIWAFSRLNINPEPSTEQPDKHLNKCNCPNCGEHNL